MCTDCLLQRPLSLSTLSLSLSRCILSPSISEIIFLFPGQFSVIFFPFPSHYPKHSVHPFIPLLSLPLTSFLSCSFTCAISWSTLASCSSSSWMSSCVRKEAPKQRTSEWSKAKRHDQRQKPKQHRQNITKQKVLPETHVGTPLQILLLL